MDKQNVAVAKSDNDNPSCGQDAAEKLPRNTFGSLLSTCYVLVRSSVTTKETRYMARALKHTHHLRRTFCSSTVFHNISHILSIKTAGKTRSTGHDVRRCCFTEKLLMAAKDSLDAMHEEIDSKNSDKQNELELLSVQYSEAPAEVEAFTLLLIIISHIDSQNYNKAEAVADTFVSELMGMSRRTMDFLGAKVCTRAFWSEFISIFYSDGDFIQYYSRAHKTSTRSVCVISFCRCLRRLLAAYRVSTIHKDSMTQATLLNLLLRNYLNDRHYELALKLVSKTSYPDNLLSNTQQARFYFYLARLQAMQLEYSDAYARVMQALRKAPQSGCIGRGFRLIATKLSIIIELLMGDIPDRQIFNQKDLRDDLFPYQQIVQAVKGGDLLAFGEVINIHATQFGKDDLLCLIRRLHHSVIRAGLRVISTSFSRISLNDVARKLGLEGPSDAESVVSKAIMDNVISATIDHKNQYVASKPKVDVYSSSEPMKAFHKRIAFCLQLRSDAIKAMQYPEEEMDKTEEKPAERRQNIEDIAQVTEDDLDI